MVTVKSHVLIIKNFYNQTNFTFQLLETKSTDRSQTLLHFITNIIQEKYPDLVTFHTELHFVDKAALGIFTNLMAPLLCVALEPH